MQNRRIVFLFSGQGSQYFHMGRELFVKNATFHSWMQRLDAMARNVLGESVIEAIYSPSRAKSDTFDRTALTHPAIFMVECAIANTLIESGLRPDLVVGASLGSFAAAATAGSITAEQAMSAVMEQALAFEKNCIAGRMIAVMADPKLFEEPFLRHRSEMAAVNFDSHFIVSTPYFEVDAIESELRQRDVLYQRLPVSFAFHSRWIDDAQAVFSAFVRTMDPKAMTVPLSCCDHVKTFDRLPDDFFWRVVRRPIRFQETIAMLECEGPCCYIDIGPSGTLATFLKYLLSATSGSTRHEILTPYGRDLKNVEAALAIACP